MAATSTGSGGRGNDVGCALRRHDPGDARHRQHLALGDTAALDAAQGGGLHPHRRAGDGDAFGDGLGADVHHARLAACVEVREPRRASLAPPCLAH
jgi:hypothetical protein